MEVTIRRLRGSDNSPDINKLDSNMRSDCYYKGKLTDPVIIGRNVFLERDGTLFCTGIVVSKKSGIFRTLNALYEIIY